MINNYNIDNNDNYRYHCAIMLDTKGPEIRTGMLTEHKSINLKKG
jgi:pyruvate kinase